MTVPAPMVTGYGPWKTTLSAIVAVESAFRGAFGGPELEERCVFVGGLRVAIVDCVWEIVNMGELLFWSCRLPLLGICQPHSSSHGSRPDMEMTEQEVQDSAVQMFLFQHRRLH